MPGARAQASPTWPERGVIWWSEKLGAMTYKAYIDNIKAKTGKGPEYYRAEAKKKGLTEHAELLAWLKTECGLGHGHANAMILYIRHPELANRKILEDSKSETKRKP